MRLFAEAYANRKSGMRNALAGAWLCLARCSADGNFADATCVSRTWRSLCSKCESGILHPRDGGAACAPSFLIATLSEIERAIGAAIGSSRGTRRERKGLGYYGTKRAAPAKRRPRSRRERRSSRKSRTRAVSGVFFRLTIFVKSTIRSSHYTRLLSDYNVTSRCRFRFIDRRALESIGAHRVTEEAN